MANLTPPDHLFRVINPIPSYSNDTAEYLCLPQRLDTRLDHHSFNSNTPGTSHAPHLTFYHNVKNNGSSFLSTAARKILPQLFMVKLSSSPDALRKERNILETLHERDGSETFVGSFILREQLTTSSDSSWLCFRPIFGPTLMEFGMKCRDSQNGGIPAYLVWHIFIELLQGLSFIHDNGVAHHDVSAFNVRLNLYPPRNPHRFGGYPDVQLINFGKASFVDKGGDVSRDVYSLLKLTQVVIREWSDVADLLTYVVLKKRRENVDPLLLLNKQIGTLLEGRRMIVLQGVKNQFENVALERRREGPAMLRDWLLGLLHDDLVTDDDLGKATGNAEVRGGLTIFKFETRKQQFLDGVWARGG